MAYVNSRELDEIIAQIYEKALPNDRRKLMSARSVWPKKDRLTTIKKITWLEWWEQIWGESYLAYVEQRREEARNKSV